MAPFPDHCLLVSLQNRIAIEVLKCTHDLYVLGKMELNFSTKNRTELLFITEACFGMAFKALKF